MKWFAHKICILALTVSCVLVCNLAYAEEVLTSGEIKKIRHLSRALLQSRALEKERIELEVAPERESIKQMEAGMEQLITTELSEKMRVEIEKNTAISAEAEFVAAGSDLPEVIEKPKTGGHKSIKATGRVERINASKDAIQNIRIAAEEKLPSKFAFWRTKTKQDIRNQHVVDVANSVEQELATMSQQDHTDIEALKALKGRLTLKKAAIKLDDIDPTIKTRTRHRAQ